jgi:hypothetical protein
MDVPQFAKRDGESIIFNEDGEFIFYVPEMYFDNGSAVIVGEFVNLLGILDYTIYDTKGKNIGLKRFYFPSCFLSKPYTVDKVKAIKLTKTSEQQDYRLLKYKKGDQIIVSTKVPQDIANVEQFFKLFLGGNLPTTIPYDKMQDYFIESMKLNGNKYGVNLQEFGIIISEIARDPKDLSKPFRLSKITDMAAYTAISIKMVPKYVSPHSAITSENWDEAVVTAILNEKEANSPLEKIFMN